jgi:hypothetical protein
MAINFSTSSTKPVLSSGVSGYFGQAAEAALPTDASRDTAASRIRSRLEAKQAGDARAITNQYAGIGMNNSGMHTAAQSRNIGTAQQALASGLADNEDNYQKQRQAGAGILGQIAAAHSNALSGADQNKVSLFAADNNRQSGLMDWWGKYGGSFLDAGGDPNSPEAAINSGTNAIRTQIYQSLFGDQDYSSMLPDPASSGNTYSDIRNGYRYNSGTGKWEKLPGTTDPIGGMK